MSLIACSRVVRNTAFYYAKTATKNDFRLIFGSYYTDQATGSTGKVVINASVKDGSIVQVEDTEPMESPTIGPEALVYSPPRGKSRRS